MTAQAILDKLFCLFPDFVKCWDSPENHFRQHDGSFTFCGVFAEFSHYFRERYDQLPKERVALLATFVVECVDSANAELEEAATTCFLENIAGEQCSYDFQGYLSGNALRYYSCWNDAT